MVKPETYGQWEKTSIGFEKDTQEERIIIELIYSSSEIYCFIDYGQVDEYIFEPSEDINQVANKIMKRESHGENINTILSDIGFELA